MDQAMEKKLQAIVEKKVGKGVAILSGIQLEVGGSGLVNEALNVETVRQGCQLIPCELPRQALLNNIFQRLGLLTYDSTHRSL